MDKVHDQNDTYTKTLELAAAFEREAVLNESEADRLEVEADRLREVAKDKRAKAKEQEKFANEVANPKKAAKKGGE